MLSFDSSNKNTNSLTNIRTPKPILLHISENLEMKNIYELLPIINTTSIAKYQYILLLKVLQMKRLFYIVFCVIKDLLQKLSCFNRF